MKKFIPILFLLLSLSLWGQEIKPKGFLEPADTFNAKRFWIASGTGAAMYTGLSITLWKAWYKDYPLTSFHTFNDMGEWENMDKYGHFFSAYGECNWFYGGAKWTGLTKRQSIWVAAGIGTLIQGTIEVMDGFSEKWGFSVADIAFNTGGVGLFAGQELLWGEQRIMLKMSNSRKHYPRGKIISSDGHNETSLFQRADDLYGSSFAEQFLKDYNAQTLWMSFNISSFVRKETFIPKWLNLAIGYGAENMFGGYTNEWTDNGAKFDVSTRFPRYRQYYLSFDIDFTRIPTKNRTLKAFFRMLNIIKFPSPTLELNAHRGLKFYPLYF